MAVPARAVAELANNKTKANRNIFVSPPRKRVYPNPSICPEMGLLVIVQSLGMAAGLRRAKRRPAGPCRWTIKDWSLDRRVFFLAYRDPLELH